MVAAISDISQHRTPQLTLPGKWQSMHAYEMRQFWHWTVSLLAAALQTVSYIQ